MRKLSRPHHRQPKEPRRAKQRETVWDKKQAVIREEAHRVSRDNYAKPAMLAKLAKADKLTKAEDARLGKKRRQAPAGRRVSLQEIRQMERVLEQALRKLDYVTDLVIATQANVRACMDLLATQRSR